LTNNTTIDALIAKNNNSEDENYFDIGKWENFKQVFGITWWTYPFPFFIFDDPCGDGINWI